MPRLIGRAGGPLSHIHSTRDLLVLAILDRQPAHGAEVFVELTTLLGSGDLQPTTIYSTLRRLARQGLAEPIGVRADAPRNSRSYRITDAGTAVLHAFRDATKTAFTAPKPPSKRARAETTSKNRALLWWM